MCAAMLRTANVGSVVFVGRDIPNGGMGEWGRCVEWRDVCGGVEGSRYLTNVPGEARKEFFDETNLNMLKPFFQRRRRTTEKGPLVLGTGKRGLVGRAGEYFFKRRAVVYGDGFENFLMPLTEPVTNFTKSDGRRNGREEQVTTFVTGNKGKLAEVQAVLSSVRSINLVSQKMDLPELQGDPVYVSKKKCSVAAGLVAKGAVITEDTSLCFDALGGMPGAYVKWFLEKAGLEGLNRMLDGFEDRTAWAQTVIAYCEKEGGKVRVFVGRTKGTIVRPRGGGDFGWDAIFECKEGGNESCGLTYAEMSMEMKNRVSHRGKALAELVEFLEKREEERDGAG